MFKQRFLLNLERKLIPFFILVEVIFIQFISEIWESLVEAQFTVTIVNYWHFKPISQVIKTILDDPSGQIHVIFQKMGAFSFLNYKVLKFEFRPTFDTQARFPHCRSGSDRHLLRAIKSSGLLRPIFMVLMRRSCRPASWHR
jgi:hypothetical protein